MNADSYEGGVFFFDSCRVPKGVVDVVGDIFTIRCLDAFIHVVGEFVHVVLLVRVDVVNEDYACEYTPSLGLGYGVAF